MKQRNGAKAMIAQPKFRSQVVRDRSKYNRKRKHKRDE